MLAFEQAVQEIDEELLFTENVFESPIGEGIDELTHIQLHFMVRQYFISSLTTK